MNLIATFYAVITVVSIIPIYVKTRQIIITDKTNKQRKFVIGAILTPFIFAVTGALLYFYNSIGITFVYFPLLWCCGIIYHWMNNQTIENDTMPQILSPTFTANDISDWRCRSLLVPHEVIRAGLNTMLQITDNKYYKSSNMVVLQSKINTFFTWYNKQYICVFNHHRDEEDIYFPWLESQTEKLPPKISDDHASMNGILDNIKNAQQKFKTVQNKNEFMEQLNDLNAKCIELKDDMEAHLNEEEETIPGLLRKYNINQEDEDRVVSKIVQNLGLEGNKIFLPWIIDMMYKWGGQDIVTQFMACVPAPILFLNYIFWIPNYEKNNKQIVKEIIS